MKAADPAAVRKSRMFLLLVALVFAAPMLVAGLLSWSGWQPGVKGNGHPILPQRNFVAEQLQVRLGDGTSWPWRDSEPRFTLIALAGPDCAAQCFETLTGIAKARVMLNRNQSRLRLLYLGTPPADPGRRAAMQTYWKLGRDIDGKLAAYVPATPDSVSAVLVESNGTALSLYPAGFEVPGLLRDMVKVIR
ncbi:hypothetical protein DEO45_12375 [Rhodanobacter denitrificans]|uniref:Uncharacterized protein n=1 Tax=Rhodanobacter denitrificans TaxID=666685 RepID=A0A368KBH4_9GAMM|nr:hypothetical protein [Rhodanobacter denitrificans]RCS29290.1 hypothetical protein DEO45_12375 [Rhodanobacter denitrificans]